MLRPPRPHAPARPPLGDADVCLAPSAAANSALYRRNPRTDRVCRLRPADPDGYDSTPARPRRGRQRIGVPICHIGDMRALFDQIPLDQMNTSMTSTRRRWLLALYQVAAEETGGGCGRGQPPSPSETGRDDAERHHQGIPLARDLCLPRAVDAAATDVVTIPSIEIPKWNPTNICSGSPPSRPGPPVRENRIRDVAASAVLGRRTRDRCGVVVAQALRRAGQDAPSHLVRERRVCAVNGWRADARLTDVVNRGTIVVLRMLAVTPSWRGTRRSACRAVGPAVVVADPAGPSLRIRPVGV